MFNNIGRWIFFKQPARKNLTPAFGLNGTRRAFKNNQLHKRALIRICFPRGGSFASAQTHDNFAKTQCFPGL
jgi:hypothetical protein